MRLRGGPGDGRYFLRNAATKAAINRASGDCDVADGGVTGGKAGWSGVERWKI